MFAHNLIPFPFFRQLNAYDLLMFALGSMVIISILNFYYNRIPKSNTLESELKNPIYDSKDVLLQSNNLNTNFIIEEKSTSIFVKMFVYILIALVVITPLYQLLGVEHFL
ncbi:hypothetical protein H9W90_11780 [Polaribacter pectinis]|uniref:Uncharacterized protein n=1 Tax=Polaribacter pectinis TaxID=2738844 RepID=A0A7G9L8B9_9FLAO|nr:hypothetical protein [Polaribacter pectinis]QNM84868.1 hypothetical protein H9W90_11780 [Polaribacter pectinis]